MIQPPASPPEAGAQSKIHSSLYRIEGGGLPTVFHGGTLS